MAGVGRRSSDSVTINSLELYEGDGNGSWFALISLPLSVIMEAATGSHWWRVMMPASWLIYGLAYLLTASRQFLVLDVGGLQTGYLSLGSRRWTKQYDVSWGEIRSVRVEEDDGTSLTVSLVDGEMGNFTFYLEQHWWNRKAIARETVKLRAALVRFAGEKCP